METIIKAETDLYGVAKYAGQPMTKADFTGWESDDNYLYEFNNGILEPGTGMKQNELGLLTRLEDKFFSTEAFHEGGRIRAEVDVWLTEQQLRRPDVAYFSAAQLALIAIGEQAIPGFVVEFGSESDNEFKTITKRHEYFAAGVQVLWWVYPAYQEVFVYTSPKTVSICTDTDVLSAAPVLPDLQLTVAELFRR